MGTNNVMQVVKVSKYGCNKMALVSLRNWCSSVSIALSDLGFRIFQEMFSLKFSKKPENICQYKFFNLPC